MQIKVKVKAGAKKETVESLGEGEYVVCVKQKPQKGKANQAVLKLLAKHFKTIQSNIKIVAGLSAKTKIIEVV